jgi:hypothetical protein
MTDRAHLARIELARQPERDRGARSFPVALEQAPFRDHEVDPCRLNARDGADGARQLAFQRTDVVDPLHEARGGKGIALVEDLVADAAAARHALGREVHAQLRHVVLGCKDRGAVGTRLVADPPRLEILDDRRCIALRQIGIENRHRRLRHPHDDEGEERDQRHRDAGHRDQTSGTQTTKEVHKLVHVTRPATCNPPHGGRALGRNFPVRGERSVKIGEWPAPSSQKRAVSCPFPHGVTRMRRRTMKKGGLSAARSPHG